jgi:cytochrome c oxidase accessory protein FixG
MSRSWVYPHSVKGAYQRLHRWTGLALQVLLFAAPWIEVGGAPALWIDIPGRRLYLLGALFTPRDTSYLVLLGLLAAFGLFFFTALYGRLWCGWGCPQTVFLEEWVRPLEHRLEGERGVRRARDRRGLSFDLAWRKLVKWSILGGLATVVSMTLVSFFTPARELWAGRGGPVATGITIALSLGLFFDFAWFREQLCNWVCPYARFQGALTDDHSKVIAYDRLRASACIDCRKCEAVCPQGIDIREGFQLECVNCARCVDACAGVMGKLGSPTLIDYTTTAATEGRPHRPVRPRTVLYAAILTGLAATLGGSLATRHDLEATIGRAPGSLFTVDSDGWVRNTYLLQVENRDLGDRDERLELEVRGLPADAEVILPPVTLAPGRATTVPVIVRVSAGEVARRTIDLVVVVRTRDDVLELPTTFKTDAREG